MRTADQNYMMNPEYKRLVDFMENELQQFHYSPSEMREAAMLACVRFESRQVRPMYFDREQLGHLPPEAFR